MGGEEESTITHGSSAEGLPKYVNSGEGVEVCDFDIRDVERSYVPTKRSEYIFDDRIGVEVLVAVQAGE
ncbi:hypothetical protein Tco_1185268 [Tanacetum coccineum]